MITTRHGLSGIGVRPYLGFSPKTPAVPPDEDVVSRLTSFAIGGKRAVFLPKTPLNPPVGEIVSRLTSFAIGGKRASFEPKIPPIPPEEGIVSRLTSFGIGGRRAVFEAKAPVSSVISGGGKFPKEYEEKKKQGLTQEEADGLEAYGKARLGISDKVEEIISPIEQEIVILSPESIGVIDRVVIDESLDSQVKDEILLMMAIMQVIED